MTTRTDMACHCLDKLAEIIAKSPARSARLDRLHKAFLTGSIVDFQNASASCDRADLLALLAGMKAQGEQAKRKAREEDREVLFGRDHW